LPLAAGTISSSSWVSLSETRFCLLASLLFDLTLLPLTLSLRRWWCPHLRWLPFHQSMDLKGWLLPTCVVSTVGLDRSCPS
jgi:hypothetical protein